MSIRGYRVAVRWVNGDNDSSSDKYIMTSAYIFDRVYERRPTYPEIYGISVTVYMIYVNIGDGG
jgi:hypothetical protein